MTKKFFHGNVCSPGMKFIDLSVSGMQAAVLLRTALNKMESYGSDSSARIKKDKGGALLSTIRATRARFEEIAEKCQKAKEELVGNLSGLGSSPMADNLAFLYDFDMAKSFLESSDLICNTGYADILSHQAVLLHEEIRDHVKYVKPLFKSMQHGGGSSWKAPLVEGCPYSDVDITAKKSLDTLNGSELKSNVQNLIQASG